jgi:hypothetical protein
MSGRRNPEKCRQGYLRERTRMVRRHTPLLPLILGSRGPLRVGTDPLEQHLNLAAPAPFFFRTALACRGGSRLAFDGVHDLCRAPWCPESVIRRISRAARRPAGKARGARISGYANDEQRRRTGCPASELCDELLTQDTSGLPTCRYSHGDAVPRARPGTLRSGC